MGANKSRRKTQAERTAESARRLMDAAIELIAEQGFDRTTAAEIGERAGYSRSMVHARYGSKEALLQSIFGGALERRLIPADDTSLTGLTWVLALIDHVMNLLRDERQLLRAICVISFEAAGPIPSLRQWFSDWLSSYERQAEAHLRTGQVDGSVRTDLDPEHEASQFLLTGLGLVFRWTLDPDGYDLAGQLAAWRSRLEAAYTAPAPASAASADVDALRAIS